MRNFYIHEFRVSCAFWLRVVIGSYFFENAVGAGKIRIWTICDFNRMGAIPHFVNIMQLLKQVFNGRFISRNDDAN